MSNKSILVIEDERQMSDLVKIRLEAWGYDVLQAFDGQSGLETAQKKKPDLILLDLMLPKMGGIDVCKSLKADEEMTSTKIVMVTAKDTEKDELKGMNVGADDYIMKPFEPDELHHVVNQVLKQ